VVSFEFGINEKRQTALKTALESNRKMPLQKVISRENECMKTGISVF